MLDDGVMLRQLPKTLAILCQARNARIVVVVGCRCCLWEMVIYTVYSITVPNNLFVLIIYYWLT